MGAYSWITSFLNNQFGTNLKFDADISNEILKKIRVRKYTENSLANKTEERGWYSTVFYQMTFHISLK